MVSVIWMKSGGFWLFFVLFERLLISESCQSTSNLFFSVTVFKLKVSARHWILKPSVSCSAAVHHCHPFHPLFSPFSTPSLASLSLSDVRLLEERLLGNDCSHFSSALSLFILLIHPQTDGWGPGTTPASSARSRQLLCDALQVTELLAGMSFMLHLM